MHYTFREPKPTFEWDEYKNQVNVDKHGVSFEDAQYAFDDPNLLLFEDTNHSSLEHRQFCIGQIDGQIITVRFTMRGDSIRILGAGYWRKGKKLYEKKRRLY